jgi:predicted MFS family arabinose efflux permease
MITPAETTVSLFTPYQKFVVAILSILQFTIILDFMVLSPLGAILMPELKISTSQFGWVVSAYAFSAGISGLLAAGFADKFDRKKLLLFFYSGFVLGTFLCAIATDYAFLLAARIVTGIFGGVIGSIGFAIVTDLFRLEIRGRAMGFMQMSFSASQVLGLPIGLYLANKWNWHAPFFMIVGLCVLIGAAIVVYMKPVDAHLKNQGERNAIQHLFKTVSNWTYLKAFGATTLLATGGFMLMPFGSAFGINNLGLTLEQLPMLYVIVGAFSILTGPLAGRLADKHGRYLIFVIGTAIGCIMVITYTHLGVTPLWVVIILNILLFTGITARMVSSSTLVSAIPDLQDRGAFMGVNASVQQISGGIASAIAGMIVIQSPSGKLERYPELGYVVAGSMIITVVLMFFLNRYVQQKLAVAKAATPSTLPNRSNGVDTNKVTKASTQKII